MDFRLDELSCTLEKVLQHIKIHLRYNVHVSMVVSVETEKDFGAKLLSLHKNDAATLFWQMY